MQLPDFLTQHDDGEICLTGHRIGLWHVVHYYNEGYSPEMLFGQFPTLPLALIHKVIAFYLENKRDVDEYIRQAVEVVERQRSEGRMLDVVALRERLAAQQAAGIDR